MKHQERSLTGVVLGFWVIGLFALVGAVEAADGPQPGAKALGDFSYRISASQGSGQWRASLTMTLAPDDLHITLNGKPVTSLFNALRSGTQTVVLAPDDGLRFGRNELVADAVYKGRAYPTRSATFDVADDKPLASAGPDGEVQAFSSVQLDGTATLSRAELGGINWRVVGAPAGSRARLTDTDTLHPSLTPDVHGTYKIRLTVSDANGQQAADTVTLSAKPSHPKIGLALETMATQPGGGYAITLGANCTPEVQGCASQVFPYGSNRVQLLILDRGTLAKVVNKTYAGTETDFAEISSYIQQAKSPDGSSLVILGALGNGQGLGIFPGFSLAIAALVSQSTGVPWYLNPVLVAGGGWSVIGVPLQSPTDGPSGFLSRRALGDTSQGPMGNLKGYLQHVEFTLGTTSTQFIGYNFVSGGFAAYNTSDTTTDKTNTMLINGVAYTSDNIGLCSGGFQLVVLRADTLTELPIVANQTFRTNCSDGGGPERQQIDFLASTLSMAISLGNQYNGALVFLQSIGTPILPSDDDTLFYAASQLSVIIESLGGVADAFNKSMQSTPNSGYAIAGSTTLQYDAPIDATISQFVPEASGAAPGMVVTDQFGNSANKPVFLNGLLQRNYLGHYTPASGGATIAQPALLPTIAFQAPTPWPTGATLGEQAALAWFSDTLLGLDYGTTCYTPAYHDVRAVYCDLSPNWNGGGGSAAWSNMSALLNNKDNPVLFPSSTCANGKCGFTESEWNAVYADLQNEIRWVDRVISGITGPTTGLQTIYGHGENQAEFNLQSTVGGVLNALRMQNSTTSIVGYWFTAASDLLAVVAVFVPAGEAYDAAKLALGVMGSLGNLTGELLQYPAGGSVFGQIRTTAAKLPADVATRFQAANDQLGHVMNIVVGDYGKLQALGETNKNVFQWSTGDVSNVTTSLSLNAQQWAYGRLLGSFVNAYGLLPDQQNPGYPSSPAAYNCFVGYPYDDTEYPFGGAGSSTDGLSWIGLTRPNIPAGNSLPVYGGNPNLLVLGTPGDGVHWASPPKGIMQPIFSTAAAPWPTWFFRHNFVTSGLNCSNVEPN